MRYFRNTRFKTLFIAFPLLMVITIFAFLPIYIGKHGDVNTDFDINKTEEDYDKFRLDKISVVKRENARVFFYIFADKVIHRKRISRLFVYQNLKEIYMSGVKIDFYLYDNTSKNNHESITIPVVDIGSSFTSFGNPSTPMKDYFTGNADINSDLLTRILFDGLSINIYLPNRKKISLTGKSARLSINFENIVFEGSAKIVASDGKELIASQAVWSKKFNGLYLPDGYKLRNHYTKKEAFFTIDREGRFSKVSQIPKIDYADSIEDKEKVFYASLSKKMSAYVKFMLGIPWK